MSPLQGSQNFFGVHPGLRSSDSSPQIELQLWLTASRSGLSSFALSGLGDRVAVEFDISCYFLITGLMEAKGRFGLFRTTGLGLGGLMVVGAAWGLGKLDNSCFSLLRPELDGF